MCGAGAKPFFLPPYSPGLNPIEQVFAKLRTGSARPPKELPGHLETHRHAARSLHSQRNAPTTSLTRDKRQHKEIRL
ncbi:MAG: hypothetical protein ACREEK_08380 [Bradyrhizobium sp.]